MYPTAFRPRDLLQLATVSSIYRVYDHCIAGFDRFERKSRDFTSYTRCSMGNTTRGFASSLARAERSNERDETVIDGQRCNMLVCDHVAATAGNRWFDVHSGQRAVPDWLASRLTFFHTAPRIAPLITNTVYRLSSPFATFLSLAYVAPSLFHYIPGLCARLSSARVPRSLNLLWPRAERPSVLLPLRCPSESPSFQFFNNFRSTIRGDQFRRRFKRDSFSL